MIGEALCLILRPHIQVHHRSQKVISIRCSIQEEGVHTGTKPRILVSKRKAATVNGMTSHSQSFERYVVMISSPAIDVNMPVLLINDTPKFSPSAAAIQAHA